jgi:hypothetical protein
MQSLVHHEPNTTAASAAQKLVEHSIDANFKPDFKVTEKTNNSQA